MQNHFAPKGLLKGGQERFRYIDMAYFMGMILVVWGHSHPLDSSWWNTWYASLNGFIYTFHMQLYFFLGGYLLVHSKSIDRQTYGAWAREKLLKFLIPYLVLTLLAFVPKFMLGDTSDVVELSLGYLLKTTFFIPRIGVWGHFWFIPCFLILDLIWGFWRSYAPKSKMIYQIGLAIGIAVSLLLAIKPIRTDWFVLYDLSQQAIFYVWGIIIALVKPVLWDKIWKRVLSIVVCAIGTYFLYPMGNYSGGRFVVFIAVGFLLVWVFWNLAQLFVEIPFALPEKLSKYAFNIYIYSWPAQAAMDAVLRRLGVNWLVIIGILFVTGFTVPLLIVWIYRKVTFLHCRFFDYLIGIKTVKTKG